jgi:hypothetical protein
MFRFAGAYETLSLFIGGYIQFRCLFIYLFIYLFRSQCKLHIICCLFIYMAIQIIRVIKIVIFSEIDVSPFYVNF